MKDSIGYILTMRLFAPILGIFITTVLFRFAAKENGNSILENLRNEVVILRGSKISIYVGISVMLGLLILIILAAIDGERAVWVYIGFGFFMLLGLALIIYGLRWRITVFRGQSYFLYRSEFGRTKRVEYAECLYYQELDKINTLVIQWNKKKIPVDTILTVNIEFLKVELTKNKVPKKIKEPKKKHQSGDG